MALSDPHIAIVHDWLVSMRGGERVLEALCELYPRATLFTLVRRPGMLSPAIERMEIRTSFLQRVPFGARHYQYFLPLFPAAARSLDLRGFDLVISSSHAAAKSVRVDEGAVHVCYCHTPMRYIWDQFDQYFGPGRSSWPVRAAMRALRGPLQRWDVASSLRVDAFIANSRYVKERIRRIYDRDADVIYPPVDTGRFGISQRNDGYFLVVSALVPYKRVDLAVDACTRTGDPLLVVGDGAEAQRLRARAGANVRFLGYADDTAVREAYEGCAALLFPGEEDFGIVPVEAMACGKPVIAYGRGGATETVVDGATGLLFAEQSVDALAGAIERFRGMAFDAAGIRAHAERFDGAVFRERMLAAVAGAVRG
jgi:glycosyltransferase involved in cell wall biosynthesis